MQGDLVRLQVFAMTDIAQHAAGQKAAFFFVNLPADDLAAEDIEEQVEVEELPANGRRQWSKKQGVVELFPCFSSPNRTCTFQRIRLSA
jgi:hypothetical protein